MEEFVSAQLEQYWLEVSEAETALAQWMWRKKVHKGANYLQKNKIRDSRLRNRNYLNSFLEGFSGNYEGLELELNGKRVPISKYERIEYNARLFFHGIPLINFGLMTDTGVSLVKRPDQKEMVLSFGEKPSYEREISSMKAIEDGILDYQDQLSLEAELERELYEEEFYLEREFYDYSPESERYLSPLSFDPFDIYGDEEPLTERQPSYPEPESDFDYDYEMELLEDTGWL